MFNLIFHLKFKKWRKGQVNIISTLAYTLIFEAIRGSEYLGDISLDDIALSDGGCPLNQNYGCDFDENNDICGFKNSLNSNFIWNRYSGETPTENTGPSVDHTVWLQSILSLLSLK